MLKKLFAWGGLAIFIIFVLYMFIVMVAAIHHVNTPPAIRAIQKQLDSVQRAIQEKLKDGQNAILSDLGNFDRICVFTQDDSDTGFALLDMNRFLLEQDIRLTKLTSAPENPDNIILLIKGHEAIAVYDWKLSTKSGRGWVRFKDYEEKGKLCLPWANAVISSQLQLIKKPD